MYVCVCVSNASDDNRTQLLGSFFVVVAMYTFPLFEGKYTICEMVLF